MSALYERLLDRLAELDHDIPMDGNLGPALRTVVERHKPVPCGWLGCKTSDTHRVCSACGAAYNFPCPEITDIARELGVDGGE